EIRFFVGAFRRAETGKRQPSMLVAYSLETLRCQFQRFLPAGLAEMRQRVARIHVQSLGRALLADQRLGEPLGIVDIVEAAPALPSQRVFISLVSPLFLH